MDKADVQKVKDGSLVRELKGLDAAEARVDVDSCGQFGQQGNSVLDVSVQVDFVLFVHAASKHLLAIALEQMIGYQCDQAVLHK